MKEDELDSDDEFLYNVKVKFGDKKDYYDKSSNSISDSYNSNVTPKLEAEKINEVIDKNLIDQIDSFPINFDNVDSGLNFFNNNKIEYFLILLKDLLDYIIIFLNSVIILNIYLLGLPMLLRRSIFI